MIDAAMYPFTQATYVSNAFNFFILLVSCSIFFYLLITELFKKVVEVFINSYTSSIIIDSFAFGTFYASPY